MMNDKVTDIIRKLHAATLANRITWIEEPDGWFKLQIGSRPVIFRRMYYEATNQPGADPLVIEFSMYACNWKFAVGTEGFDLLMQMIVHHAGGSCSCDPDLAMEYLNRWL